MLALLDDLLEMARLGTGDVTLQPAAFEPRDLLDDVLQAIMPVAQDKGNAVRVEIDQDPGTLWGDPVAIRRILLNFGINAAKYTSDGQIVLGLRVMGRNRTSVMLEFRVSDTGIGIAESDLQNLFRAFARLEAARAIPVDGTGLGLAICKALADAMQGEVAVQSRPGMGSTFYFRTRLAMVSEIEGAPDGSAARPPEDPAPDLTGRRILLVEDNDVMRSITCHRLEAAGAHVTTAADGAQAVAAASAEEFDVILMDLRLPVMCGAEAASRIRESSARNAGTPIFALTARVTPGSAAAQGSAAITTYLAKPLDLLALRMALRNDIARQQDRGRAA